MIQQMRFVARHARASGSLLLAVLIFVVASGYKRPVYAADSFQFQSSDGRRVMTAVRAPAPISVDGAPDEDAWRIAEPAADFVQAEPHEGQPATEPTEVRIVFDSDALYIGVICHDATPHGLIVNDIRKDFTPGEQDSFEVRSAGIRIVRISRACSRPSSAPPGRRNSADRAGDFVLVMPWTAKCSTR
jgi:hypothetical protein